MAKEKILGLIFALLPLPGLCLDLNLSSREMGLSALSMDLSVSSNDTLSQHNNTLYLSDANQANNNSSQPGVANNQATADQIEFPHLDLPSEPDWDGLKSDTKLFLLYQVAVVGVIYFMPESTSQWDEEDKSGNIFGKWDDNVTGLRKDEDDWGINYIGHPYFGAVYYVRARHRGFSRKGSFWYSFGMSTLYEYGIEALFEPTSIQDLIFTPVGGAIMGEYFMTAHENLRRGVAEKGYADTSDKIWLFMTDPLGAINRKVTKSFGSDEARLDVYPLITQSMGNGSTPEIIGLQANIIW
jgi:hypothetical protein